MTFVMSWSNVIAAIEARKSQAVPFIEGRYPYTYAYDYLRSHAADFGLHHYISRSECAGMLRNNPDKEAVCIMLAEAYLREHDITKPAHTESFDNKSEGE